MKNKKVVLLILIILLVLSTILIVTKVKAKENINMNDLLEAKYERKGKYNVEYVEYESLDEAIKKYSIWYPSKISEEDKKYPVIIITNGTGATAEKHSDIYEHLASWGFIVIGNADSSAWTGNSTSTSLDYIIDLNDDKKSIFYNKINKEKIGVNGHSQGGVGAINAITDYENSKYFKSIFTASCAWIDLSETLGWDYDIEKINIPYFMVAGTRSIDANLITPLESMEKVYNNLNNNRLTIMARRKNADHQDILEQSKGYMTAWFLYTLKDDKEAEKIFKGDNSELFRNIENWQDIRVKND